MLYAYEGSVELAMLGTQLIGTPWKLARECRAALVRTYATMVALC
jgi:hypothetical protein